MPLEVILLLFNIESIFIVDIDDDNMFDNVIDEWWRWLSILLLNFIMIYVGLFLNIIIIKYQHPCEFHVAI